MSQDALPKPVGRPGACATFKACAAMAGGAIAFSLPFVGLFSLASVTRFAGPIMAAALAIIAGIACIVCRPGEASEDAGMGFRLFAALTVIALVSVITLGDPIYPGKNDLVGNVLFGALLPLIIEYILLGVGMGLREVFVSLRSRYLPTCGVVKSDCESSDSEQAF